MILEMLRRHGVRGGRGRIVEYYGPGLQCLSAMDRHVIANMGTELGATATVFPSDDEVRRFLKAQGRESDWSELLADSDAEYDYHERIDLSSLEPLIATPPSPGNVVPVREVAGEPIYQAYIGSSSNPGYRDFAVAALMVRGHRIPAQVSFDVNPTSRQILETLARDGHLASLIRSGARLHQTGCNGCIGMGQAPATDKISLRTVPRNFRGRSGTRDDQVYLVSPETAVASALSGKITDPRTLGLKYPRVKDPDEPVRSNTPLMVSPLPRDRARRIEIVKGPNIKSLPIFEALPDEMTLPVLLTAGDDITTDAIMPAGAGILPFRSNIPKISEFVFELVDPTYNIRAKDVRDAGGHAVVGGKNYGQGSSREHATLAPRYLGLRVLLAKGFARIYRQNLINFGILPLEPVDDSECDRIQQGDVLKLTSLRRQVREGPEIRVENLTRERAFMARHNLFEREIDVVLEGGLINWAKKRL